MSNIVKITQQLIQEQGNQRAHHNLTHARRCRDDQCQSDECPKFKRILNHIRLIKTQQKLKTCNVRRHINSLLCHHAERCNVKRCKLFMCRYLRPRMKKYRLTETLRNEMMMRLFKAIIGDQDQLSDDISLASLTALQGQTILDVFKMAKRRENEAFEQALTKMAYCEILEKKIAAWYTYHKLLRKWKNGCK